MQYLLAFTSTLFTSPDMFRLPGLFLVGRPMAFTSNISTLLKSSLFPKIASFRLPASFLSQLRSYRLLTWKRYNRHYQLHKINWKLLAKPALFTGAFCLATSFAVPALFLAKPLAFLRRSPNIMIYSLIAVNIAGFLAWRTPATARLMSRYGILLKDNLCSNWSLLGLAFSHQDGMHLLFNMFMLYSFGTTLCAYIGPGNFLAMYLNSAVVSSFFSVALPTILRTSLSVGSLGASGAILSVFGSFCYLFPKASIGFFFIPIPGGAWFVYLATVAFNVAGVAMKWGKYDYAAHLGGCLAGIVYGWWYDRIRREKLQRRVVW